MMASGDSDQFPYFPFSSDWFYFFWNQRPGVEEAGLCGDKYCVRRCKLVDVVAILKIKPAIRRPDILAWEPTRTGVFSVKSAYGLGMEERRRPTQGAASRAPDGRRAIWKQLWGCPAPLKVRIFGWKLATNSLATWENKHRRNMEISNRCIICGIECESTYHALCRCPRAKELWQIMKDEWQLPDTAPWANYGDEWVLALLDGQSELQRTRILMTLWRCWHIRNEIVHDKPAASIESSRRFLCSYLDSLMTIKHCPQSDDVKGKQPAAYMLGVGKNVDKKQKLSPPLSWRKPDAGAVKLNVDGSYNETSGEGGTGMILRDNTGAVLFLACRFLPLCSSPLEAELQACLEGIQKARSWTDLPCVVESECKEVVSMLSMTLANRSHFAHVVQEIKELLKDDPRFQIVAVFRQQNKASHLLANFGRSTARTVTWIRSAPENVLAVCLQEGPPVA